MADHGLGGGEALIVHRQVELAGGDVSSQGAADLDGTDRLSGICAAAEAFDQFAQRHTEGLLDEAALADVSGELEGQRAARAAHAVILVCSSAL